MSRGAHATVIVGSGIAGLYVAVRCREANLRPLLITKSRLDESNTRYAQGGIAAAIGPGDNPELHRRDTVRAGDGLVDPAAARALTAEAPIRIADLVRYGVPFDTVEGRIALGLEGGHSHPRILHAGGDATGLQIEETLRARAVDLGVEVRERAILRALRSRTEGKIRTVLSAADGTAVEEIDATAVVLATGGAGSLYRQSSNPAIATGDGVSIAFRAGALVTDMEFVQFHPTAFCRAGAPRYLITEALRGEGAALRDDKGRRFLPKYHPDAELAPRDVVSRAIEHELRRARRDCVYLDATGIPRDRLFARFPTICRFLAQFALDPSRDQIPVAPAAHYMIGGVTTDLEGRTTLRGLLACGEVASTGVHGANRLGSNSLVEGVVFGERVVRQLLHPSPGGPRPPARHRFIRILAGRAGAGPEPSVEEIRDLLWNQVGIIRSGPQLRSAVRRLRAISRLSEPERPNELPGRLANAAAAARLVAEAALEREESRGAHYRSDFPHRRAVWHTRLGLSMRRPP